jgi:hypothetical protein
MELMAVCIRYRVLLQLDQASSLPFVFAVDIESLCTILVHV